MAEVWARYDGGAVTARYRNTYRNAQRIRVAAGVAVIPEGAFAGCRNLTEIDLSNVTTIFSGYNLGRDACISLERVIWSTASAVEIGDDAFAYCSSLAEIDLHNVTKIGGGAFHRCTSLTSVTIPSSVAEIEDSAFEECTSLAEVTLREGTLCIEAHAFADCTALEYINIPPMAMVVDFERSRSELMRETVPTTPSRKLVASSKWMQCRNPDQLEEAEAKVNEILGRPEQTEEEKIQHIRDWFAYCDLLDVTTMLELAIWRCNNGNGQGAEARQRSRRSCGSDMNIIIPCVLPFLEG